MIRAFILAVFLAAAYLIACACTYAHENGDPDAAYYRSLKRPDPHGGGSCCDGPHAAAEMGNVPDCVPVPMRIGPHGYEFFWDKSPVERDLTGISVPGHGTGDHVLLEQGSHGKNWWVVPDDVLLRREAPSGGDAIACIYYGTLLCFNPSSAT